MTSQHVVVIGVGSIGERHTRCFQATGRTQVSIVESNASLADEISKRYGVTAYSDINAALAQRPTAAVIATPAPLHIAQAIQLVEAGVNVLIEKPLSISIEGVDRLQALATERKSIIGVAYVLRAYPVLAAMRNALQSSRFGTPRQITALCGQHFPTYRPAYREIYYANRAAGGGAIQDALTHMVNMGEWLVGPVDRLVADAEHLVLPGVEVEDTVHLVTRQGAVMGNYSLNQHQAPNETILTVNCDHGTVRCEMHNNRWMWMTKPGEPWQEESFGTAERDTAFIAQANAFLDALEGKRPVLCPLEQGIQTLKVNIAALESVERRAWVSIN
ncbi:MAG: Gfo/Idh/MocA family oxidoreductase [Planctomycetota bacterium]